jgi:tRNA 2-selenouridine synthase
MSVKGTEITEFMRLQDSGKIPVFDSRSEIEYIHAHIPGALNIPLLNNDERKEVGTLFRQKGREAAVLAGFRLVGPRFHEIILRANELAPEKEVMLYCWRGGMRSQIMTWLLQMNGFRVITLKGGYKAYRHWVGDAVNRPMQTIILGGPTGSGKTEILDAIKERGEQVLQLEALANHRGSAFGSLGKGNQPSNEQFENSISMEWMRFESNRPVWIENESRSIGSCILPLTTYSLIRNSILIEIEIGLEKRKQRILEEYGKFPVETLAETTRKIGKRMGPQHMKQALIYLESGDKEAWLDIVLDYYDKQYSYGTTQRNPEKCFRIDLEETPASAIPDKLIQFASEKFPD